ncbi:transcription factor RelB homolog isoform X2 [Phyllopteryx taeniolatus]|uniref:transcription factor RelB homolog isoform X2 n=1 Tax=Phyllopteryx taeniolatus TaxID=161469 RepID=UPI002AD30D92|nr:transcription factor RelB homolog isoform X2 [Phyllopteryx taeniolatus]
MDVFRRTPERELSDFDLIQEIITEDHTGVSLPRPPPAPAELRGQNHRMHQLCSSSSSCSSPSQPVLVARGTACQSSCTFNPPLQQLCSPREMAQHLLIHPQAGSSRCGRGPPCPLAAKPPSTTAVSSKGRCGVEMLERNLEKPKLAVVEQPKERGMRFRYECEGRSAGSILGESGSESNKTQPAVEIHGSIERLKKVTVTVSLVTKDPPHRPHPHCLVGKDCPNGSGICVVTLNPHSNRRHSFANLGIQCVRRKELDVSLQKRRSQNIDPFQTGHSKGIEDMDMNAVRLCFQCELEWDDGTTDSLSPVVSNPIYDKKATTTSQLKISQLNQYTGACTGKTEIYMLCDKVQKDDIEIIFRRGSWKANGEFAQTDVHRQIAIVFKTPPYQDQDIAEEVDVSVTLRRLSDQMESEPVTFTYLPYNPDPYEVKRKRKMKSDMNFQEKANVTAECAASPEQSFRFPHAMMSPCSGQPGPAPLGEMCYAEPLDANMDSEDMALISQLLELPGVMDMFSDPAVVSAMPDAGQAPFANTDANPNQNFGLYTQDFSHYADLQFNMLVNENRNMQTEPKASLSNAVHVKIEDDL